MSNKDVSALLLAFRPTQRFYTFKGIVFWNVSYVRVKEKKIKAW